MHLIFIRHADPDYKTDGLTAKGLQEALLLQDRISSWKIEDIYSSPMGRALRTAEVALEKTGRKVSVLPWLREFNYHVTDPKTGNDKCPWDWLPRDYYSQPVYFDKDCWDTTSAMESGQIREHKIEVCSGFDKLMLSYGYKRLGEKMPVYLCKEHISEEEEKIDTHLNAYQKTLDDRNIVFFCHFGVMMQIIAHLTSISSVQLWQGFFAAPSSVTILGAEERVGGEVVFRVQCVGDCSHLLNAKEPPSSSGFFGSAFGK